MNYFFSKTINGQFDAVVQQVTAALKEIGFGIITTIDVKATLKEKIDADFKPYTILGACNPHFANKALRLEDKLGVILPCNVVVIDQGDGKIEIAAMEPLGMIQAIGNDQLTELAADISKRIGAVVEAL